MYGPRPPVGTIVYDLYGAQTLIKCDKSCVKGGFEDAQYVPGSPMSEAEFAEFKQRLTAVTSQFQGVNTKAVYAGISFAVLLALMAAFVAIPFVDSFAGVVVLVVIIHWSRVVQHNYSVVDPQIHDLLHEYNTRFEGRVALAYVTAHVGMCKPRRTRPKREIWIAPPGQLGPVGVNMGGQQQQHQQQQQPMGQPVPMQMPPPPPYAPGAPAPAPPYGQQSAPAPPYGQQPAPAPPYGQQPPGNYPALQPSIQKEVFYAKVPAGVKEGDTFQMTTPSGRSVEVVAPTGAREGLEFQTNA